MSKGWVLVTDGGSAQSRDCIAAVRGLHAAGYGCAVTLSGPDSALGRSRYVSRTVHVPTVDDSAFADAIAAEQSRHHYVTVLPASEHALLSLRSELQALVDKLALTRRAAQVGVQTPPAQTFASPAKLRAGSEGINYPAVVKPALKSFSAFRARSPSDLRLLPGDGGRVIVQPFLDGEPSAVCGVMWHGRMLGSVHERWLRTWPLHCGLASAAVTVDPDPDLEGRLALLLHDYDGIFCAQFVDDYLIDLNLRVYSTHSLAVKAGLNPVAMYCDLLRGEDVVPRRAVPGVFFRWLEGDIRSVLGTWRKKGMGAADALRALTPRRDAAHSIESIGDPGPLLARLGYAAGRLHMDEDARRVR